MIDVLIVLGTAIGLFMMLGGFRRVCELESFEEYYYGWVMFWAGLIMVGIGLASGVWNM